MKTFSDFDMEKEKQKRMSSIKSLRNPYNIVKDFLGKTTIPYAIIGGKAAEYYLKELKLKTFRLLTMILLFHPPMKHHFWIHSNKNSKTVISKLQRKLQDSPKKLFTFSDI